MAKKSKTKADASPEKIRYTYGNKLFEKLDLSQLWSFIEKHFPSTTYMQRGMTSMLINCLTPGHPDLHPSMYLDVARGYVKCKSCGYYTRNLLQLLEDCKGWSPKEALHQIQVHTGLRLVTEKTEKALDELDIHQLSTKLIMRVCNEHLAACVRYMVQPASEGDYTAAFIRQVQPSLDWLFRARGRKPEYVPLLPYGLWPPVHMLFQRIEKILDEMTTEAYAAKDRDHAHWKAVREKILIRTSGTNFGGRVAEMVEKIDGSWTHAVAFFTGHSFTTPGRVRLRRPDANNVKVNNILELPGHGDDTLGYFGLYSKTHAAFNTTQTEQDEQMYLLVEGEHDALAVMEQLLETGKTGVVVLASCGVHNLTDALAEAGIKRVYLWADEPVEGNSEEVIRTRLQTAQQVEVRVFTRWHEFKEGSPKDPDDVCRAYPFHDVYRVVVTERAISYKPTEVWAFDRVIEVVHDRGIPEDEIRARQQVAVDYGSCVRHPAQLETYVARVAAALGLAPSALRSEIVNNQDTEMEFISRIAQTIQHEFHRLYKVENARGGELFLFHKKTRRQICFYMTDGKAMVAQLSNVFGEIHTFFKDHVGLPGGTDENIEELRHSTAIKESHKTIREYLEIGMQTVYKGVLSREECEELGQGIHFVTDPEFETERCLYVNNGNRVYRGRRTDKALSLEWVELEGPSDGRYLFRTATRPWSQEISSVTDLIESNSIPLDAVRRARDDLFNVFFNHWCFETQRLDALFLATHIFGLSVHNAFAKKTILSLTGETHTGKSTLLSVFCGKNSKDIRVLEVCDAVSDYSPAAIYQTWDKSAIVMALDEFENDEDGTSKSKAVQQISEQMRNLIGESGASVQRGSADGGPKNYRIHVPMITSAITRAKKSQDENRRYVIETKKKEGLKDPSIALFETVTPHRLAEIRRLVTLGLLVHVHTLADHYEAIRHEINTTQITPTSIPQRFLDNFLGISAVMALLGEDWRPFVRDAAMSREQVLASAAQDTASNNLAENLLRASTIKVGQNSMASLFQLLGTDDDWRQINSSQCGVYWDEAAKLLVVDWIAATSPNGLLGRMDTYNHSGWRTNKHHLDQHPLALRVDDYTTAGVFTFLKTVNVVTVKHVISVLRLRDLVTELRSGPKEMGSGTANAMTAARHEPANDTGSGNPTNNI